MIWLKFGERYYNLKDVSCIEFHKREDDRKDSITVDVGSARYVHTFGVNLTEEEWKLFLHMKDVCNLKVMFEKGEER